MKYGQTLKQRSVREWGPYNLDYDEIKHVIKEHSSPGKGKAISIPGQDRNGPADFEQSLFELLRDQHQRIELFVKSKSSEVEKRLDHLSRQIRIFRSRINPDTSFDIPVRQLERFGRIETDILRAGQDIRSLSRFVGAQRLGFTKLLKKYKKWTGSSTLGERFRVEVLDQSLPLSRHNLDGLLDHWAEVLHAFRSIHEMVRANKDHSFRPLRGLSVAANNAGLDSRASSTVLRHMHHASTSLADVDFDTSFTALPVGDAGTKAVYWIHPDQVVEVTVMLMQYLRPLSDNARLSTAGNSTLPSSRSSVSRLSLSRHGSISQHMSQSDLELDTGALVLDDLDEFAQKQSSSTITEIQHSGSGDKAPRGRIRWTSNSEAVVVLKDLQHQKLDAPCGYQAARIKRKYLHEFLSPGSNFDSRRSSIPMADEDYVTEQQRRPECVQEAHNWLTNHDHIQPLATITSRRARFQGLTNDLTRGQWAVLDQNVYTTKASPQDIAENDWSSFCRHSGTRFPYVVLQVRQEGPLAVDLIDLLDRSYLKLTLPLTERVRGFSLETQAVWSCCKPLSMAPPSWLSLLQRDIRKLPNKEPLHHHSVVQFHQSDDTTIESDPTASSIAAELSSSASGTVRPTSSSTTLLPSSGAEQPTSATRATRKTKKAKLYVPDEAPKEHRQEHAKYWNEYDDPEDEDDSNAYVIYIDPDAPLGYPGQAMVEKIIGWITSTFGGTGAEDQRLLDSPASMEISPADSATGEEESSADEFEARTKPRTYGTLPPSQTSHSHGGGSWWSLLNPFMDPERDGRIDRDQRHLHLRDPFAAELEQHFHAIEASKMRHCLTSLASAVALLVVSFILAATGRHKRRGTVNEGVLFGVIVSLLFAFAGVGYLWSLSWKSRHDLAYGMTGKWLLRGVVALVFVGVCIANGALIAWMVA